MSIAHSINVHSEGQFDVTPQSRILRFPERPDLGPVKTIEDESVEGGVLINVAGVVELARTGGTPQAKAIYRAFCNAWDELKDEDRPEGDRQFQALQIALKVIGLNIGKG